MISEIEKIKLLGQTDLFGSIPVEQQKLICSKLGMKHFKTGEFFFHEGDSGDEAFILFAGKADVIKSEQVLFHLAPGDIVGEMAPISEGKRSASVKAVEDVQALFLKSDALKQLAYEIPDLSFNIMRVIIKRVNKMDDAEAVKRAENITATAEIKKPAVKKAMSNAKCPNCHERIVKKTVVCVYCGYSFYANFLRFSIVTALCLLILASGAYVYHQNITNAKVESKTTSIHVPLVTVKTMAYEKISLTVEKYGRVHSTRNFTVTSELKGRIVQISKKLKKGYVVDVNEPLLKISEDEYKHAIRVIQNQIRSISVRLKNLRQQQKNIVGQIKIAYEQKSLVQQKWDKNQSLYDQKGVSESVLLQIKQELLAAEKNIVDLQNEQKLLPNQISVLEFELDDAHIKLENAKTDLKNTFISAPFRARVKEVYIEEKSLITPQMRLLVLEDLSYVEIPTLVPLNQISDLLGSFVSREQIWAGKFDIEAKISAFIGDQEYIWDGTVTRFEPMNEEDYTIPIIVGIKNEENKQLLEPGSFVKVVLKGQTIENALVLSRTTLRENNTIHIVQEGKLETRQVKFQTYKDKIIVKEGLAQGEKVVLRPLPFAISGMKINIKELGHESN